MRNYHNLLLLALALAGIAHAHMQLIYPPALKSKYNPNADGNVDYSMTSPLSNSGSDFPCKGYLTLLGTPQGRSVATWSAGGTYNFTLLGGATHGGGSCQASLSLDAGKTFRVLHSYEGGCPRQLGQSSYGFAVPPDVPATAGAVFAWSWFNNLGNREMYMNCAVVDVVVGGGGGGGGSGKVPFGRRPLIFEANIGNGCRTVDSADVKFPDPGPDVDVNGKLVPPTGTCGAAAASAGGGGNFGSGSGSGAGSGGSSNGGSESSPDGSAPSNSPNSQPAPQPTTKATPDPVSAVAAGWTPGNDWPAWYRPNTAPQTPNNLHLVVWLWLVILVYYHFL